MLVLSAATTGSVFSTDVMYNANLGEGDTHAGREAGLGFTFVSAASSSHGERGPDGPEAARPCGGGAATGG